MFKTSRPRKSIIPLHQCPPRPPASPATARKTASGKTISPVAPTVALKIAWSRAVVMGLGLMIFSETFAGKVGLTSYLSCEGKGKKCKEGAVVRRHEDALHDYELDGHRAHELVRALSPTIRTGHAGTQKLVCLAMGLVRVPMTYKSVMGALGQGFSPPIPMVLLNVAVVGVYFAASVGVEKPSLPSWSSSRTWQGADRDRSSPGPAVHGHLQPRRAHGELRPLGTSAWSGRDAHDDPDRGLMGLASILMRLAVVVVGDKPR